MSKIVVLAEKPSVGREIARVLNCKKKENGYIEGNKYIVTWALGHLVTLADPEVYEDRYATWKIEDLPMLPNHLKLIVIKKTRKQYETVKRQLLRKDVSEIVIATDAGREGELVARWIIDKARVKKPLKRLWISSVTDKAIKDGFNKLKAGRDYENLYASAVARAEADWIVGINATRALTCKYNAQLSCGRVQTPTLAMVVKREEEIKNFKPKKYYGITAVAEGVKFIWQDQRSKDTKSFDQQKMEKINNTIMNKNGKVMEVRKTSKKSYAPKLYDLTELQRDANRIFNFSAKETLSIMQSLYESHKVLTYPRTDSRYLTHDIVDSLKDRIKACQVGPYKAVANTLMNQPIKPNKSFVDDKKVSDHHAIIPTEESVVLTRLSDKERKIYDLVVKRFLAVLYPPCEYEQITIKVKIGDETFIAKGKNIVFEGWKKVYKHDVEEEDNEEVWEQQLPSLKQGDPLKVTSIKVTTGETKPPAPLNEGTLLSAMENPAKYMTESNKELIKVIGETGGIGTVATRADIIEKLLNNFLMEKRGKDIFSTSKGRQLLDLVPNDLKSPDLTANWEQKLILISKGNLRKDNFINDMKQYTKSVVTEIKNSKESFKHDNLTMNRCPECGKFLLEVNGKKGKMLVCQDRACGYRKGISKVTNTRCPNCHKKLELRGQGEGQILVCVCGYREKMNAFKKRKNEKQDKGSKRDINQYLKKQKKEDDQPFNSAFGDALNKLKL